MTTSSRRVVFLGTHGQYNIGDELLLETFLTQLGPEHRYVVNSYDPDFTRSQLAGRFDVEVIDTRHERARLLRELLRCDALVFGGGSIVKELYASTGRHPWATLLMILAVVTFTRRVARKPIAMFNVGVGPLRSSGGLRLARMVLSQVDELTVRDEQSVATCRRVGVQPVLATDAVFSVAPEWLLAARPGDPEPRGRAGAEADRPLRVALNLNFDIENPANWETFLSQLTAVLERLHAHRPVELHTLPMQAGFKEHDDVTVIDAFLAGLPGIPVVRHDLGSHVDAARVITRCDVVVSERLHAIVMASILGVPAFVLSYDVKVRELARILQVERWTVDVNQPFDVDDVADRLAELVERREEVSAHVRERSAALRTGALEDVNRARAWLAGRPAPVAAGEGCLPTPGRSPGTSTTSTPDRAAAATRR